jgi:hypothetical protein
MSCFGNANLTRKCGLASFNENKNILFPNIPVSLRSE